MTRYIFPYEDYYKQSFVDPLYLPYTKSREPLINPYTMNTNEIRYNWGQDFRKKYSEYPCPMGFKNKDLDFCTRYTNQLPHFYTDLYKNIVDQDIPLKDFTNYKTIIKSVYPVE
jgi:hypothetical protein